MTEPTGFLPQRIDSDAPVFVISVAAQLAEMMQAPVTEIEWTRLIADARRLAARGARQCVMLRFPAALCDPAGNSFAGPGEGRLGVKGPVGCRYLDDPRQSDYVVNGWNMTGDIFRRDADGNYSFVSRADDIIVSSGYNIAAIEVEQAVLQHPDVAECAVLGVPDSKRGKVVKALVVPRSGVEPDEGLALQIQTFVKNTIAPYKYPRAIEFVSTLPRTVTGKISRNHAPK